MGYVLLIIVLVLYYFWKYLLIGIIAIVSIVAFNKINFWKTHLRPLNENEKKSLAEARRVVYINEKFSFTHSLVKVNSNYRGSLDKFGRWDRISLRLTETLSFLTQLLRYKRHEWLLWVLVDDITSKFLWANKGEDNSSCYFRGSISQVIRLAKENRCDTVICMHNHPHTKERSWNLLSPSEPDRNTFKKWSFEFDEAGLNFIDVLCSQGEFIIYGYNFSKQYIPLRTIEEEIRQENGISEEQNYKLHKELHKIKSRKISIN